ncbi:zinc-dependent alcohol dehydrogenase [Pseudarthrobacter sp. NS4]|uniref:zinc-dependent alcohol dehydrogenase n=1 Tax=Pseudarthrobacter sp. NS4 TaxID=2973976 RepID=UPI0021624D00|nr:zinc-dependent alcohol dehydrogenase [Pseudarthrobacter sp. NS4]
MRALTWQGKRSVSVEQVPDPVIQEPTDAIIRITSTAICGSDLHLYEVLGPYMSKGDVLGHEPMGIVEEVGSAVSNLAVGDPVVIPFNIACGTCLMCNLNLQSQCETTQVREKGLGARIFGYSELYGSVPGGQAEYLRVPFADYGPIKVGQDLPDVRYLYLSDIVPTAWQGVQYADVPDGGTLAVFGLGPVGQFAARAGVHLGYRVIGIERVPERRAMAERHGVATLDYSDTIGDELRDMTGGRGPDSVLDAVGMEAHGSPVGAFAQQAAGLLPDPLAQKAIEKAGVDRLNVLHACIDAVRRGGTVSISGVYGGMADPMPMLTLFDKQIQMRMGQCNVKAWIDDLLPLVEDPSDPLGVTDLATHEIPLDEAPAAYEVFQKKQDNCIKVILKP